jgi:hypothetical protein
VPDRAADDDVDALHRDPAARGRITVDDEQAAPGGCSRRLARVPLDDDRAGHKVLGEPWTRVPMHAHGRELVHPRAVVADVPVYLDLDLGVDAAGHGVGAVRVEHAPAPRAGPAVHEVVEALVELAERGGGKIDDLDRSLGRRPGHGQTFCRSQA